MNYTIVIHNGNKLPCPRTIYDKDEQGNVSFYQVSNGLNSLNLKREQYLRIEEHK